MSDEMPVAPSEGAAPSNQRNIIIGVVVAVVLCCGCIIAGVGGTYVWNNF